MNSKDKEALLKVRSILSDESRWTQNLIARRNKDSIVEFDDGDDDDSELFPDVMDESMTCFCLIGALYRANEEHTGKDGDYLFTRKLPGFIPLYVTMKSLYGSIHHDLAFFNDYYKTRYCDVIEVIDKAIESL